MIHYKMISSLTDVMRLITIKSKDVSLPKTFNELLENTKVGDFITFIDKEKNVQIGKVSVVDSIYSIHFAGLYLPPVDKDNFSELTQVCLFNMNGKFIPELSISKELNTENNSKEITISINGSNNNI